MLFNSITDLIGNTPLVRLHKIEEHFNIDNEIYAKLERNNPCGSIKDRTVLQMLKDYQKNGIVKPGSTIIESTSGNTGIALSALGTYFGYHIIIVMPTSMSEERKQLIHTYGAELILVDGGMKQCVAKAEQIKNNTPDSIIFGQFVSSSNPKAHLLSTAIEIENDLPNLDYIFAGIGTGGTITGLSEYFKDKKVKCFGIEPEESPILTLGYAGSHKIQGLGANFIPSILNLDNVQGIIDVNGEEAIECARLIVLKEGLLVGISSGAALLGAINYLQKHNIHHKKVVVIFPDTGERYSWN